MCLSIFGFSSSSNLQNNQDSWIKLWKREHETYFHTWSVLQHMCHSPNIRPTDAHHTCNATANACYNQSIGQSKKYFCASSFLARPHMSLCMCESLHLCLHPNICPGRQDYWERDRKANPFPVGEKATGSWSLSGGAAVTQHCQVKSHLPSMLPPSC